MSDGSSAFLSSLKMVCAISIGGPLGTSSWHCCLAPTSFPSESSSFSPFMFEQRAGRAPRPGPAAGGRWPCGPLLPRQVRSGARYRGGDATTDAARKYHRPALVAGAGLLAVLRPGRSNHPRAPSPSLSWDSSWSTHIGGNHDRTSSFIPSHGCWTFSWGCNLVLFSTPYFVHTRDILAQMS